MNKEYEEPFDEQASLERLEALGKQDRIMAEKQMTDEELFDRFSYDFTPTFPTMSKAGFLAALTESRKGMFTEAEVKYVCEKLLWECSITVSDDWMKHTIDKYLTERKGRG